MTCAPAGVKVRMSMGVFLRLPCFDGQAVERTQSREERGGNRQTGKITQRFSPQGKCDTGREEHANDNFLREKAMRGAAGVNEQHIDEDYGSKGNSGCQLHRRQSENRSDKNKPECGNENQQQGRAVVAGEKVALAKAGIAPTSIEKTIADVNRPDRAREQGRYRQF